MVGSVDSAGRRAIGGSLLSRIGVARWLEGVIGLVAGIAAVSLVGTVRSVIALCGQSCVARFGVLACVSLCLWAASAEPAVAARWSVQVVPEPAGFTIGGLSGVSCPSRMECFAVGYEQTTELPRLWSRS